MLPVRELLMRDCGLQAQQMRQGTGWLREGKLLQVGYRTLSFPQLPCMLFRSQLQNESYMDLDSSCHTGCDSVGCIIPKALQTVRIAQPNARMVCQSNLNGSRVNSVWTEHSCLACAAPQDHNTQRPRQPAKQQPRRSPSRYEQLS